MNTRLHYLRKSLKLSQEDFGKRLGVTGASISRLEKGERNITEQMILSICREYNVREEWIRYGSKPMYIEESTFSLDDFVKKNQATDLELEILKAYFELDPDLRKAVIDHFKNRLLNNQASDNNDDLFDSVPDTPEELEKRFPPVEESGSEVS